jgi:hypothetical protein
MEASPAPTAFLPVHTAAFRLLRPAFRAIVLPASMAACSIRRLPGLRGLRTTHLARSPILSVRPASPHRSFQGRARRTPARSTGCPTNPPMAAITLAGTTTAGITTDGITTTAIITAGATTGIIITACSTRTTDGPLLSTLDGAGDTRTSSPVILTIRATTVRSQTPRPEHLRYIRITSPTKRPHLTSTDLRLPGLILHGHMVRRRPLPMRSLLLRRCRSRP